MFAEVSEQCLVGDATRIRDGAVWDAEIAESAYNFASHLAESDDGLLVFAHHLCELATFLQVACFVVGVHLFGE